MPLSPEEEEQRAHGIITQLWHNLDTIRQTYHSRMGLEIHNDRDAKALELQCLRDFALPLANRLADPETPLARTLGITQPENDSRYWLCMSLGSHGAPKDVKNKFRVCNKKLLNLLRNDLNDFPIPDRMQNASLVAKREFLTRASRYALLLACEPLGVRNALNVLATNPTAPIPPIELDATTSGLINIIVRKAYDNPGGREGHQPDEHANLALDEEADLAPQEAKMLDEYLTLTEQVPQFIVWVDNHVVEFSPYLLLMLLAGLYGVTHAHPAQPHNENRRQMWVNAIREEWENYPNLVNNPLTEWENDPPGHNNTLYPRDWTEYRGRQHGCLNEHLNSWCWNLLSNEKGLPIAIDNIPKRIANAWITLIEIATIANLNVIKQPQWPEQRLPNQVERQNIRYTLERANSLVNRLPRRYLNDEDQLLHNLQDLQDIFQYFEQGNPAFNCFDVLKHDLDIRCVNRFFAQPLRTTNAKHKAYRLAVYERLVELGQEPQATPTLQQFSLYWNDRYLDIDEAATNAAPDNIHQCYQKAGKALLLHLWYGAIKPPAIAL